MSNEISPMARRIAANWMKSRVALEPVGEEADGRTALPKSGPGKAILKDNLKALEDKLESNDHPGFKRALGDLNSNFEKVDAATPKGDRLPKAPSREVSR